jgi:hypothetical protein
MAATNGVQGVYTLTGTAGITDQHTLPRTPNHSQSVLDSPPRGRPAVSVMPHSLISSLL